MMKLSFGRRPRNQHSLGDVYEGNYFPSVVFGRTASFVLDIHLLIIEVLQEIEKTRQSIFSPGTFKIFSSVFSRLRFSHVLTCTELEDAHETFDILGGTIANLLRHTQFPPNEEGELLLRVINMSQEQFLQTSKTPDLLTPLKKAEDGTEESSPGPDDVSGLGILLIQTLLMFAMFALASSQYVNIPYYNSSFQSRRKWPFNVSLDTLRLITSVVRASQLRHICPELPPLVDRLLFRQRPLLRVYVHDGPQYFYQDRTGQPLPFGFDRKLQKCIQPLTHLVTDQQSLQESAQRISKSLKQLVQINQEIKLCESSGSRPPLEGDLSEEAIKDLLMHSESIANSLAVVDQTQAGVANLLELPTSSITDIPIKLPSTLESRLSQLQQPGKRMRRSATSHRNPSGLAAATTARPTRRKPGTANSGVIDVDWRDMYEGRDFGSSENRELETSQDRELENSENRESRAPDILKQSSLEEPASDPEMSRGSRAEPDPNTNDALLLALLGDSDASSGSAEDEKDFDLEDELFGSLDGSPNDPTPSLTPAATPSLTPAPTPRLSVEGLEGDELEALLFEGRELDVAAEDVVDEGLVAAPRKKRKPRPTQKEEFVNPFDEEFESMFDTKEACSSDQTLKPASKRSAGRESNMQSRESKKPSKRPRRTDQKTNESGSDRDADWKPKSRKSQSGVPARRGRPPKSAAAKPVTRTDEFGTDGPGFGTGDFGTGSVVPSGRNSESVLSALSQQVLHPSIEPVLDAPEDATDETKKDEEMTDEQLLRELEGVIYDS